MQDFGKWPLNEGWPLNRWPLNKGPTVLSGSMVHDNIT